MDKLQMREHIRDLLHNGQYEALNRFLLDNREKVMKDNDLMVIFLLLPVCEQERKAGQMMLFEKERNLEALLKRCTKLRFYLHRIEFGVMDGNIDEFYEFMVQNAVSSYELLAALDYNVIDKDRVLRTIREGK